MLVRQRCLAIMLMAVLLMPVMAATNIPQALLDALTILRRFGRIEGLKIAICGDIANSRVARSNLYLLGALGAELRFVSPSTLLPAKINSFGVPVFHQFG